MEPLSEGLFPAMGYALWHLSRGESVAAVRERMERDPRTAALSASERATALAHAQHNLAVTNRAGALRDNQPIGAALGRIVAADTQVGVRVLVTVEDGRGGTRDISVVVGARASASIEDIIGAVRAHVESGALNQRVGFGYSTRIVGKPSIFQVVEGGLPGAAIGVL